MLAKEAGSDVDAYVTTVPPWPSLAAVKLAAVYWPSSSMLAVWTPSVTVSVPLSVLEAAVKFNSPCFVTKSMPRRSI
jgi:hypothetical protein